MTRRSTAPVAIALLSAALLARCSPAGAPGGGGPPPDRVEVQHILISFAGRLPGKPIRRSHEEARALAHEILERARGGEDFDALVRQHTDDQHPGIYAMANRGVAPRDGGEFPRDGMVRGFGDTAFALAPGAIGMCDFDPQASPYGWHIIKRLR